MKHFTQSRTRTCGPRYYAVVAIAAACALAAFIHPASADDAARDAAGRILMVDPAMDAEGPFCYLSKPTLELALMAAPRGAQLTFDGAIFTGAAEYCFFYGEPLRPVCARIKTLHDGWAPIIQYSWKDGDLLYTAEAFTAALDGNPKNNGVHFIRVSVKNNGAATLRAHFAAALRGSGVDHRFGYMRTEAFRPDWKYEMTPEAVWRNGKLMLAFDKGAALEAVPGVPYAKPFQGNDYEITDRAETCLIRYSPELAPGAEAVFHFKAPNNPIPREREAETSAIFSASYDHFREVMIKFWNNQLARCAQLEIPEKKVLDAHRANLAYDWMAIWQNDKGQWVQGVNKFQYNWFWIRDSAYILGCYDLWGRHDISRRCLEYYFKFVRPDGNFASQEGQYDGFGQALFALGRHAMITGDYEYAKRIYPYFPPAIAWLKKARAADPFHIMPRTEVFDNEFIAGHYSGHNFWALLGVRTAARMAAWLGHEKDRKEFLAEYKDFHKAFLAKLTSVAGEGGYIPPGLDAEGGQDWGNLLGVYPSEVLDPFDPRITATLAKVRRDKYQEGVMTYKGRIHQYVTVKATQNFVARGEQKRALEDFYGFLLHTGSAHEGFEWETDAWGARDTGANFPPHGWGAAMFNTLLRNMIVRESGGQGGVEGRDLHLFSVISPAWAIPGREVSLRNAPTELGPVSVAMKFRENGADVTFEGHFRAKPNSIILHIPYFATLQTFEADAKARIMMDGAIVFGPDVKKIKLEWTRNAEPIISYDSIVDAYKKEYAKRFAAYIADGGKPLSIEAPPMLSASERHASFVQQWGKRSVNLATGKPVTVSGGTEKGHDPELAVDGFATNPDVSSWWAAKPPRWLQVNLESLQNIGAIRVFPYWDGSRYYQYTVEVSKDGSAWEQVADMSANRAPATPQGVEHVFAPRQAQYVRVNLLRNSANEFVHLVELQVFPPASSSAAPSAAPANP